MIFSCCKSSDHWFHLLTPSTCGLLLQKLSVVFYQAILHYAILYIKTYQYTAPSCSTSGFTWKFWVALHEQLNKGHCRGFQGNLSDISRLYYRLTQQTTCSLSTSVIPAFWDLNEEECLLTTWPRDIQMLTGLVYQS